ncbi:methylated-DNA--[protein]-cysteine S-methyltransferase [soil metagenome]
MSELYTTYYQSPVGGMEIKGTESYIVSVLFVEQVGETALEIPPLLQLCIQQFDEYFAGTCQTFTIPVQQTGTEFQQRVWDALRKIEFGQTFSYLEIALRVGDVHSVRAVGNANGKNKVNIIVPCHRVIGSNGKLVGYGGGLWRKQRLLEHEAKFARGILTLF